VTAPPCPTPTVQQTARDYRTRTALRPAVWAVAFWIAGELCGFEWGGSPGLLCAGAFLFAVLAGVALVRQKRGIVALAALSGACVLLGWGRVALWQETRPSPAILSRFFDQRVVLSGTLTSTPEPRGRVWRFGLKADTLASAENAVLGPVDVFVRMDTSLGAPCIGQRVRIAGSVRALPRRSAPGTMDYGEYLRYRGYSATLAAYEPGGFAPLPVPRNAWTAFWDHARSYVKRAITVGMPDEAAGLASGLVLGERHGLSRRTMEAFSACGVIHILSVSGFHVAIVLVGIGVPLRRFFGFGLWQALVLIACAWCYSQLAYNDPPMVRSCIMATVLLLAYTVERRSDPWNALALSALITLLVQPTALHDIGFQLSYAAMAGLMGFGSMAEERLKRFRFLQQHAWVRYPISLAVATVAANITTAPLTAHYFWRMSLLALVGNLPITALVTVGVWASVAAALVGWIPFAAIAINAANARVLEAVLRLGDWFAEWPYAATWVRSPTWPEMLVYGVGTCAIWWISQRKGLRKGALFACLIYANIAVWWIWIHRPGTTEIAFLDVGQGDAAVCRFSTGHTIVIDGGPATAGYDAGDWVVVPYLRSRGIRRVDAIVVTHSDSDHIGGLPSVAQAFDTRAVWYNGSGDTASAFRALESNIRQRGGRLQVAGAGDSVAGLGTAQMTFLSPMRDSAWSSRCSDNDRSLVLRIVEYGDTVLFTGDTGEKAERAYSRLLPTESGARVDVLKVAHHGSRFSTGETLLATARPRYAVISVGRNMYGHPARETLEQLRATGTTVFRTDRQGTLIWRTGPAGGRWVEWR